MNLPYPLSLAEIRHPGFVQADTPKLHIVGIRTARNTPGRMDDAMWFFRSVQPAWEAKVIPCETEPGVAYLKNPMNPKGTATMAPGWYKDLWVRGNHKGRPALVQFGTVTVWRDGDKNATHSYDPLTADTGKFGIDLHDIANADLLAGCQGILRSHMAWLLSSLWLSEHEAWRRTVDYVLLDG